MKTMYNVTWLLSNTSQEAKEKLQQYQLPSQQQAETQLHPKDTLNLKDTPLIYYSTTNKKKLQQYQLPPQQQAETQQQQQQQQEKEVAPQQQQKQDAPQQPQNEKLSQTLYTARS